MQDDPKSTKEIIPMATIVGSLKKYWCDFGHELDLYDFTIEVDKKRDPHIWLNGPCQTCIGKSEFVYVVPYDTSPS